MDIRKEIEKTKKTNNYVIPGFSTEQMFEIRKGFEYDLDVASYTSPENSPFVMRKMRHGLLREKIQLMS